MRAKDTHHRQTCDDYRMSRGSAHRGIIRKCGDMSCDICKPVCLPQVFEQLIPFPDPEPGADQHYKTFNDIYGTKTSEKYWPTLSTRSKKQRTLPFHGKAQHVRNADLMLECEECGMWRMH